jgi:hypothetical protein
MNKTCEKNSTSSKYFTCGCITLKERNTKRFVQNWHSPTSPSTEWSWFVIELEMFSLFSMQLDYCKECLIKSRNYHCCILMPENCFRIRVTWFLYKMMFSHRHLTRLIMGCKVSGFVWFHIIFVEFRYFIINNKILKINSTTWC